MDLQETGSEGVNLLMRLRVSAYGGSYEPGNDSFVFMKRGVFLGQLRDVWLSRKTPLQGF